MTAKYVYKPRICTECGGELLKSERFCRPCRRKVDPFYGMHWDVRHRAVWNATKRNRTCKRCGGGFVAEYGNPYIHICPSCKAAGPVRKKVQASVTRIVSMAVYLGILPKLDGTVACVDCGAPATDYDHRDYNKPLEVEPTCHSCNLRRGPAIPLRSVAKQAEAA